MSPRLKMAIVHDNFAQMGGAERVAESLCSIFPNADLYSTLTVRNRLSSDLSKRHIQTTWMQHLPATDKLYRHYFLLYPLAVRTMELSQYDILLSSCFGYAKGIKRAPGAIHICYCHTPPRWIWRYNDYSVRERFGRLQRWALPILLRAQMRWDLKASQQPDYFIANSTAVAERIREYYGREAVVIPPPINISRFNPSAAIEDYYLVLSRLIGYKRIDLAIQACNQLGRKLLVIGTGPDRERLEKLAGPTIQFLGRQPDHVVSEKLSRCKALLFPGEEDFGMTPLEANAAGRPVIAYRSGGALDTVVENKTGLFFDAPTAPSLAEAIKCFEHRIWSASILRTHAEQFSDAVFAKRLSAFVAEVSARTTENSYPKTEKLLDV